MKNKSGLVKVAVLGATGSIGKSALDVIRAMRGDFEPVLFTAHKNRAALDALAAEFPSAKTALCGGECDLDKFIDAIKSCGANIFINGIAGAAGLAPTLAALECGNVRLALANKESVVMAWNLVAAAAEKNHSEIIPVDSEHSAIFSLINAHCRAGELPSEIIITASGGPFRTLTSAELERVTVKEALSHPTWNMGKKITIDSATLANKGLEVIEAARLFSMPPEKISVTVHPQSIVHSLIRLDSGAVYAELSRPDMRLPVHNALFYPQKRQCPFAAIEFDARPPASPLELTFEAPDMERFPMLRLAYDALRSGSRYTTAYNAANEAAVELFCEGVLSFKAIPAIVEKVLENGWNGEDTALKQVLDTDKEARGVFRALTGVK